MRILKLLSLIVIVQNITTSIQCPQNCTCDQTEVTCKGARNSSTLSNIPIGTTKLFLFDMNLHSDEELKNALKDLSSLKQLDLSNNTFTDVPLATIQSLSNLSKVTLSLNSITRLPMDILKLVRKGLTVDLRGNEMICDCETVFILDRIQILQVIGECVKPFIKPFKDLKESLFKCDSCKDNGGCIFGVCVALNIVQSRCECIGKYTGRYCENLIDDREQCEQNICLNGGTCFKDEQRNFTCTCPTNATGDKCQNLKKDAENSETAIVVGIAVAMAFLILVAILTWYLLRLRPQKRQRRRRSRKESVSSENGNGRSVQFASINNGYNKDHERKKNKSDSKKEASNPYPHDPLHARWLFGRRRCSTVLEEEGNNIDDSTRDKYRSS